MELSDLPGSSSTSSVEQGVWLMNPLVNASVKTNYNLSSRVDLSPECDLIIGSDEGPQNGNVFSPN